MISPTWAVTSPTWTWASDKPDVDDGKGDDVSVQVVGGPEAGEGMVVITGAEPDGEGKDEPDAPAPSGDYDYSGLEPDAFVFAEHGDRVVVEGGNNKFVVEVRGAGDDGEMGGSTVIVEGGNNQFVIVFDYGGDSALDMMDAGANPFGGGQGVAIGEPDPNADPAAGIFEYGSAPPLDDPNYVGGDAYVGPPEGLDTPDDFILV